MKIKAQWGFIGDATRLGHGSGRVRAGEVFDNADGEYAHMLIGKGLVSAVDAEEQPSVDKATAPIKPPVGRKAPGKANDVGGAA